MAGPGGELRNLGRPVDQTPSFETQNLLANKANILLASLGAKLNQCCVLLRKSYAEILGNPFSNCELHQ